jgi:hypothetical protein
MIDGSSHIQAKVTRMIPADYYETDKFLRIIPAGKLFATDPTVLGEYRFRCITFGEFGAWLRTGIVLSARLL